MANRKLIAGNWKMNGNSAALAELDAIAGAAEARTDLDVAICPPATLVAAAKARQPRLIIGGQDCHWEESGAHTGCISAAMLVDAGASACIVGHSERRTDQHETNADVKRKAEAVIAAGLGPILCIGESADVRKAGNAVKIVIGQLAASLPSSATGLVIAYEPIWAIGTGLIPTLDDVAEMHAAIRKQLVTSFGKEGEALRILYGGSVKPDNASDLLHLPDVDGALVGGASLKASDFNAIIAAA